MSDVLKDYGRKRNDPASKQLENYAMNAAPSKVLDWMGLGQGQTIMTMSNGCPVANRKDVKTAGRRGPLVVEDIVFFDEWQHFNREKIPERVVHAKGNGAHGFFVVTNDITKYSRAAIFSEIGKETPLFIRFSQVIPEKGGSDTVRDPRGFAIKFYTEEGNWDLVANNTPIFFTRDPQMFISFIHSQKRNPVTNLKDSNMQWDFLSLRPESTHQVMYMFGDRGIPASFRTMNGYGSNTFKLVNKDNQAVYCKFHIKCKEVRNLLPEDAQLLAGMDPDFYGRDLYNAIENGDYPEWMMYIQVMTFEEAENWKFDPFDVTKVWPHGEFPLIPVGKIVLNRNPKNYFAEVEQAAFAPANIVPGIDFSPDKMLQGRIFAYKDTQLHRLGKNFMKLPINCPYRTKVANYQVDGESVHEHNGKHNNSKPKLSLDGMPTYYPNSFMGPVEASDLKEHVWPVIGDCKRYEDVTEEKDEDNFTQPGIFWNKVLDQAARTRLVKNIVVSLKDCKGFIQDRAIENFTKVDPEFGRMVRAGVDAEYNVIKDVAPELSQQLKI